MEIPAGRTVGLVGESGSGKTSLARAIVGLVERSGGVVTLHDRPLPSGLRGRDTETRRLVQMVFQSPEEALNPFRTVGEALRRPLVRLRGRSPSGVEEGVRALLAQVQLGPEYAGRLPSEPSGGERQRVAIARALAADPDALLADEPVSSLDVSVQASILELLAGLQAERGVSTLFISHDLAVVGYLADTILVLYLGQVMEESPSETLFDPPYHPYTEALLAAVPLIDPEATQRPLRLVGELPSPTEELTGCPFHTRCPRFLGPICVHETPPWRYDERTGARIYCHIPLETLVAIQERPFAFRSAAGRME